MKRKSLRKSLLLFITITILCATVIFQLPTVSSQILSLFNRDSDLPMSLTTSVASLESKYNFTKELEAKKMEQIQLLTKPFTEEQIIALQNKLLGNQNNLCTTSEDKSSSGKSLQITEDGKLSYRDSNISFTNEKVMDITYEEAVNQVTDYLTELGIMPKDNYLIKTSSVECKSLNADGSGFTAPQTVSYTIYFYKTYNGIPIVSDRNDGIQVDICSDGISSIQYCWNNIKTKTGKQNSFLDSLDSAVQETKILNTAIEYFNDHCPDSILQTKSSPGIVYSQIYYIDGDVCTPAWIFGVGNLFTNPTLFNAETGEIIKSKFI